MFYALYSQIKLIVLHLWVKAIVWFAQDKHKITINKHSIGAAVLQYLCITWGISKGTYISETLISHKMNQILFFHLIISVVGHQVSNWASYY